MKVKEFIIKELASVVLELTQEEVLPVVEISHDTSRGDFASNVALTLFPKLKNKQFESPVLLATALVEKINSSSSTSLYFSKVEVVKPGFINFWLSEKYLHEELVHAQHESYGASDTYATKKVMVEYTDPNPFKELHIGHLYSNIIGESISRLYNSQGAIVKRACYQGDVGLHVAKTLWGVRNLKIDMDELGKEPLPVRIKKLGEAYAKGATEYKENKEVQEEIHVLNKLVYERDQSITQGYQLGRKWSLEYFESIYTRLGTKFDYYYFESEAGTEGLELVKKHIADGVFEKSNGAVVFPGEKYGLHTRVFINSLGLPTYEAKELALAPMKYKDFEYDTSIIITGNEVNDYFKVLLQALTIINPTLASRTIHLGHGMVRLPEGKMSSRTGNVLTGEWLLEEAKAQIAHAYPGMEQDTLEVVSVGAVKYGLLKAAGLGKDIEFSFHESISLTGNSGPYLQYTYVRTQSILKKSKLRMSDVKLGEMSNLQKKEEIDLLRHFVKFSSVLEDSAIGFKPHLLATYLFDLAQKFNVFYQVHKIVGSKEEQERISVTIATGNILKYGLDCLGISVPEKM